MAIGTPVGLGTAAGSASHSSRVLTTTADAPAGDAIIVVVMSNLTSRVLSSVTDSAGNTYVIDESQGTTSNNVWIASCLNPAHLASGGTISANFGSTDATASQVHAMSVSGLKTSSALDQHNSTAPGSGSAWSISTPGSTAQNDELVVGASCNSGGAFTDTPGAGYTELYDTPANSRGFTTVYKIVSATGVQTPGGTWSTSGNKVNVVATYEAQTSVDATVNAVAATATAACVAPTPQVSLAPPAAAATASSSPPTTRVDRSLTATAASATASCATPVPQVAVTSPAANATASSPSPAVQVDASVTAVAAAATAAVAVPSLSLSPNVSAPPATATASCVEPEIQVDREVTAPPAVASASCPAPDVVAGTIIAAVPALASASAPAPSTTTDVVVMAPPAMVTASCATPTLTLDVDLSVVAANAVASCSAPTTPARVPLTGYTDAVVGVITTDAPVVGIITAPTGRY